MNKLEKIIFESKSSEKKECELFFGRMQPIHLGHVSIIKQMKNPVVAIVKGNKSSQDKEKNPLTFDYQKKLLLKVFPGIKVIEVSTGYIPTICEMLREEGLEVTKIFAGPDRFKKYEGQLASANKKLPDDEKFDIEFVEADAFKLDDGDHRISATAIREAIRGNDEKTFKKLTPKAIHSEFDKLRELMESTEYINEAAQIAAAGIARAAAGALKNAATNPAVRKAVTRLSTGAATLAKKAEPAIRQGLEKSKPLFKQGIKRGLEKIADRNKTSSSNSTEDDESDINDLDKKKKGFLKRAGADLLKTAKKEGPRALFRAIGGEDVPILDKMFTYWDDDRKANMMKRGEDEREILIGEFRPFHKSHLKNYKQMNTPAIVVLKNDDFAFQRKLIKLVLPEADVYSTKRDDLPAILTALRLNSNIEGTLIRAHPSKIDIYKKQIAAANRKLDDDVKFRVEFEPLVAEKINGKDITSEMVRAAIKNNEFEKLKKLVPAKVAERYHELVNKQHMKEELNTNTTNAVALSEKPFPHIQRRKVLDDIIEVDENKPLKKKIKVGEIDK